MTLTSEDIGCKQFQETSPGLDAEEVMAFLEVIREDMLEREKELAVLKEKVAALTEAEKGKDSACGII